MDSQPPPWFEEHGRPSNGTHRTPAPPSQVTRLVSAHTLLGLSPLAVPSPRRDSPVLVEWTSQDPLGGPQHIPASTVPPHVRANAVAVPPLAHANQEAPDYLDHAVAAQNYVVARRHSFCLGDLRNQDAHNCRQVTGGTGPYVCTCTISAPDDWFYYYDYDNQNYFDTTAYPHGPLAAYSPNGGYDPSDDPMLFATSPSHNTTCQQCLMESLHGADSHSSAAQSLLVHPPGEVSPQTDSRSLFQLHQFPSPSHQETLLSPPGPRAHVSFASAHSQLHRDETSDSVSSLTLADPDRPQSAFRSHNPSPFSSSLSMSSVATSALSLNLHSATNAQQISVCSCSSSPSDFNSGRGTASLSADSLANSIGGAAAGVGDQPLTKAEKEPCRWCLCEHAARRAGAFRFDGTDAKEHSQSRAVTCELCRYETPGMTTSHWIQLLSSFRGRSSEIAAAAAADLQTASSNSEDVQFESFPLGLSVTSQRDIVQDSRIVNVQASFAAISLTAFDSNLASASVLSNSPIEVTPSSSVSPSQLT